MRKTIILGSLLALVGFTAVASAVEQSTATDSAPPQVQREASNDSRADRHDRYEHNDRYERKHRSRERHDEAREHRGESRDVHEESHERNHRR
jgi:hypothetical protein